MTNIAFDTDQASSSVEALKLKLPIQRKVARVVFHFKVYIFVHGESDIGGKKPSQLKK